MVIDGWAELAKMHDDRSHRPLLVALSGIFCFALLDALLKSVSISLPLSQVVFLRFLSGLIFATILFMARRPYIPTLAGVQASLLRALATISAVYTFVFALTMLPLATVVVLAYTAPMFMVVLGRIMLGEKVGRKAVLAIILGFAGVVVTMAGRMALADPMEMLLGCVSALVSSASYALSMILARLRSTEDSVEFTVWGQNAFGTLILFPIALLDWHPVGGALLLSFTAIGFSAVISQFLVVWAFVHTTAARIAPLEFTSIFWASLFGFVFFAEVPGLSMALGAVLIVLSGLIVMRRNPKQAS